MMTNPDYTAEARALLCPCGPEFSNAPPGGHYRDCPLNHGVVVSRVAARLRRLTDALDEIESLARVGNEDITEIARDALRRGGEG